MEDGLKRALCRNLSSALRGGDLAAAREIHARLKAEDPISVETRGFELELLSREGDTDRARELAEQLVALFPESPRVRYLAGQVAYGLRRYRQAAEHYEEYRRLLPGWHADWVLGKTMSQLGRFDEAEAILAPLCEEHPHCKADLAWLYERMEDWGRALKAVDEFLAHSPDSERGRAQRMRLASRTMEPTDLAAEMDALLELGEEVPPHLVPDYVRALVTSGRGADARAFVERTAGSSSPCNLTSLAWSCYKLQLYDLAYELFSREFERNVNDRKFHASLQLAADRCGRLEEILELYKEHAQRTPWLYSHVRKVSARMLRDDTSD